VTFPSALPIRWEGFIATSQNSPVPPHERLKNVPGPVSAIIMKLLAKTPEERYQTAAGADGDVRRSLVERESQGRIDEFVPENTIRGTDC
jgi:hypothetical protein